MDSSPNRITLAIVTINFNNFNGLKKTVNSVLNQSDKQIEFIIIDGGSTDGSKEFIEENQKKVNYWVSENDRGVYHAMNKGLEKVTAEYCLFLNSGDYLINEETIKTVKNLIDSQATMVYGLIQWEETNALWNPKKDLKAFEMTKNSMIPHQGTFFKTNILKKLNGYKENFKVISDWGIMLELIEKGYTTQKLNLIISTCEKQGISASLEDQIKKERRSYLLKHAKKTMIYGYLYAVKKIFKLHK
jgi:glycosyltransferase involved in cell wall biosynthesis